MVSGSKIGITVGVMCAALMAMPDISIVNVALTDIRASFGTPLDQIAWVSTGYMIANIVVIPMTGWFQRRFGLKRYFTISILVFTGASVLCGLAWSLPTLAAFRALQGVGGGAIIPTAQTILFTRFPAKERGTASALFGIASSAGPLLGPTVGGYLIEWANWHWIFFVNVPIGLMAASLIWRHVDEPDFTPSRERVDYFGIALLATGMASLQYVLEEGTRAGWLESKIITVLGTVAVISLSTFVVHELETPNAVINLRVFRNKAYVASVGINVLTGVTLFGASYLFSLYCGAVMRLTALQIGHIFLTAGAIQVVLMPVIGKVSRHVDGRFLLQIGIACVCASLWFNAHLTDQSDFWSLAFPQMLRAVGLSFVFIPLGVMALSNVPRRELGNASGIYNATRELGGSLGTAWMGMFVADQARIHYAYLAENIHPFSDVMRETARAMTLSGGTRDNVPELLLSLKCQVQALVLSFNGGFLRAALAFSLGFFMLLFISRRGQPALSSEEVAKGAPSARAQTVSTGK